MNNQVTNTEEDEEDKIKKVKAIIAQIHIFRSGYIKALNLARGMLPKRKLKDIKEFRSVEEALKVVISKDYHKQRKYEVGTRLFVPAYIVIATGANTIFFLQDALLKYFTLAVSLGVLPALGHLLYIQREHIDIIADAARGDKEALLNNIESSITFIQSASSYKLARKGAYRLRILLTAAAPYRDNPNELNAEIQTYKVYAAKLENMPKWEKLAMLLAASTASAIMTLSLINVDSRIQYPFYVLSLTSLILSCFTIRSALNQENPCLGIEVNAIPAHNPSHVIDVLPAAPALLMRQNGPSVATQPVATDYGTTERNRP